MQAHNVLARRILVEYALLAVASRLRQHLTAAESALIAAGSGVLQTKPLRFNLYASLAREVLQLHITRAFLRRNPVRAAAIHLRVNTTRPAYPVVRVNTTQSGATDVVRALVTVIWAFGVVRREHAHTRLAGVIRTIHAVAANTIRTEAILTADVADSVTAGRHTYTRIAPLAAIKAMAIRRTIAAILAEWIARPVAAGWPAHAHIADLYALETCAVLRAVGAILTGRITRPVATGRLTHAGGVTVLSTLITSAIRAVIAILAYRIADAVRAGRNTHALYAVLGTLLAHAI